MNGAVVIIEVNGTKRGIIAPTEDIILCQKAQEEFSMSCIARIVSFSELYGGKIAAALSRQHPRDLFDCKYMEISLFDEVKKGFILNLLGSDKPIIESLQPNCINQSPALENQFQGMSNIEFTYKDYEQTRKNLIAIVNNSLTKTDKEFIISFEEGNPDWSKCVAGNLSNYPSVQWKLQNINKLKTDNPQKHKQDIQTLKDFIK
ncbi:MAG: hypothetical protein BWX62_01009 [Bacteroidetes bacterium ADurb.Bin037]|nr:MAG: hypothetical protein BWX62_01009 [Bacteroidetes bacterium ADurb.Bin037]